MKVAANEPRATYVYASLRPGYFRLLRIISSHNKSIECKLLQAPLNGNHKYLALSYVWGKGAPVEHIIVNNAWFRVSRHLLSAARELSVVLRTCKEYQNRYLWIDAICINQGDDGEKAQQVPLMGSIFRNATAVPIWFGDIEQTNSAAVLTFSWLGLLEMLQQDRSKRSKQRLLLALKAEEHYLSKFDVSIENLEAIYEALSKLNVADTIDRELMNQVAVISRGALPALDHQIWSSILSFLSHPWFYRIWTFQEICVSGNAFALCGSFKFDWSLLAEIRSILLNPKAVGNLYSYQALFNQYSEGSMFNDSFVFQNSATMGSKAVDFKSLLLGLSQRRATLAKDYIYGLLGVLDESIRREITVDYSPALTAAQVFAQAIAAACKLENAAGFWCRLMFVYAAIPRRIDGLPSWCVDFSQDISSDERLFTVVGSAISNEVLEKTRLLESITFEQDTTVAVVRGAVVDTIEASLTIPLTADLLTLASTLDAQTLDRDAWICHSSTLAILFGAHLQSWFNRMDELFLPQSANSNTDWLSQLFCFHKEAWERVKDALPKLRHFNNLFTGDGIETHQDVIEKLDVRSAELYDIVNAATNVYFIAAKKFPYRTGTGRLGFATCNVRAGCKICFIPGGHYLHVLSSDCSEYISTTAVDGFMNDGLMTRLQHLETQMENFYLR